VIHVAALFQIDRVHYAYPKYPESLTDVSFSVTEGERVVLLGANGSGKSTLLHLLNGLYLPTSGTIHVMGHELTEDVLERSDFGPRFRKEVGFLFQNSDAQLFCPTVEEELAFAPLQLRLGKDRRHVGADGSGFAASPPPADAQRRAEEARCTGRLAGG
jgi:cobalt/nickel transport system ATP-binding protein